MCNNVKDCCIRFPSHKYSVKLNLCATIIVIYSIDVCFGRYLFDSFDQRKHMARARYFLRLHEGDAKKFCAFDN